MIPKKNGAFREIGDFPSVYRVWAKANRPTCKSWESEHKCDFFAMASHPIGDIASSGSDPFDPDRVIGRATTQLDLNGRSTVRFHYGDEGGDNYRLRAVCVRVETGVDEAQDESGLLTVWRARTFRIDAMAKGLRAAGIDVAEGDDWWQVTGLGAGNVPGGATVESRLDHRIAMAFMVMGMASQKPMSVDDGSPITTSFPIFEPLMAQLGAQVSRANG